VEKMKASKNWQVGANIAALTGVTAVQASDPSAGLEQTILAAAIAIINLLFAIFRK